MLLVNLQRIDLGGLGWSRRTVINSQPKMSPTQQNMVRYKKSSLKNVESARETKSHAKYCAGNMVYDGSKR